MELLDDKIRIWIDSAKFVKPVFPKMLSTAKPAIAAYKSSTIIASGSIIALGPKTTSNS